MKYTTPEMKIVKFEEEIIAASVNGEGNGEGEGVPGGGWA